MSLNWNIEKCENVKSLQSKKEWPVTDILIWYTMFVGIWQITEDNYNEFYGRVHLFERVHGTFVTKDQKPYFLTRDDVKKRIGLKTNAQSWTRTQFIKNKIAAELDRYVKGDN